VKRGCEVSKSGNRPPLPNISPNHIRKLITCGSHPKIVVSYVTHRHCATTRMLFSRGLETPQSTDDILFR
jgi:hypothetical protein